MYGHQGARAGGIHSYGRSLKIEVAGYPRGNHGFRITPEDPRCRLRGEQVVIIGAATSDIDSALLFTHAPARVSRILQRFPAFLEEQALLRIHISGFLE